jgi:hypothetical protein
LFTPAVKDADKIGLAAIANSVKDLAEKAKENKLKPEQFIVRNSVIYVINHPREPLPFPTLECLESSHFLL